MKQYNWRTHSIERTGKDAVTIYFQPEENFVSQPGQFINLSLVINEERVSRSYSLSSHSLLDLFPSISVKRVEGGRMSNYILDHAEHIQEWQVEGPSGNFILTKEKQKPVLVFVAGGSGITPLLAMIKEALFHTASSVLLIHACRSREDMLYASLLQEYTRRYPERFMLVTAFSNDKDIVMPGTDIIYGRLSKILIKKMLKQKIAGQMSSASYFLCGPEGLMEAARQSLQSLEVAEENIHQEYFVLPETENKIVLPSEPLQVLVFTNGQVNLVDVAPGTTILDAALADHVPIRFSCKNGTCGSCVARLLEGKVHMEKNYALTTEEVKEGKLLLCQSHPLDDKVTITTAEA